MGDDRDRDAFNVIDAFDVPRFTYSAERKKYLPDDALGKPKPSLYAGKSMGEFPRLTPIVQ